MDEEFRILERKSEEDFQDFLRYRRELAKQGVCEIIKFKKGVFITSTSGLEYVLSHGPVNTTYAMNLETGPAHDDFYRGIIRKKGGRLRTESDHIRLFSVVVPLEMAAYIEKVRAQFYLEMTKGGKEYWVSGQPRYQEGVYRLLTTTLRNFAYCQEHYLEEVNCIGGCGRPMGLNTAARRNKPTCFYCWANDINWMFGGDEKAKQAWLEERLAENGSWVPQT